jgi:hypothetical protein
MAKVKVELSLTLCLGNMEFVKSSISFEEEYTQKGEEYTQDNEDRREGKFQELQAECELRLTESVLLTVERAKKIKRKVKKLEDSEY